MFNEQPSQNLASRLFSYLLDCKQNLKFPTEFHFEDLDLVDSAKIQLCKNLFENKNCYTTHRDFVGKISTPFRLILKHDAKTANTKADQSHYSI